MTQRLGSASVVVPRFHGTFRGSDAPIGRSKMHPRRASASTGGVRAAIIGGVNSNDDTAARLDQSWSDSLSDRRWLILASAVVSFFAVGITFFAVPPLVPKLKQVFALGDFDVGVLMGAIAVPAIFLSVPLGAAIDRWPARTAGNAGLGIMLIGAIMFAVAPSYWLLLVGRLLFGVGGLIMNLLLARLITTAFAGKEVALAMGVFNSVYPASMIVVFSLHSRICELTGWRVELALLAVLAGLAIPLHNLAVPRAQHRVSAPSKVVARERIRAPLVALAVSWMLFFVALSPVFTFAPEWAGGDAKALLTVTGIMWIALLVNPVSGSLIDRFGRPVWWVAGGQIMFALILAAMAGSLIAALPAMLLIGLAGGMVPTATYALPGRLVPAHQVGFAFGWITAFSNLGTVVGPAAFGALREAGHGWPICWFGVAGILLIAAAVAPWIREPAEAAP